MKKISNLQTSVEACLSVVVNTVFQAPLRLVATFRGGHLRWAVALAGLAVSQGCDGRARWVEQGAATTPFGRSDRIVVFDLSEPLPEASVAQGLLPQGAQGTFTGFVRLADRALRDDATKGAFVRFGMRPMSWAHAEGLGRLFGEAKTRGLPVTCHADGLSNATSWLAAVACDKIWVSPAGEVDTVGVAGQALYLAALLERLNVQTDFLHVGKFKSASEPVTRDSPSPEAEESMLFLLRSIRESWLSGFAEARQQVAAAGMALEQGPWTPADALQKGLIDAVGYESDARSELSQRVSGAKYVSPSVALGEAEAASEFSTLVRLLLGSDDEITEPHVVVLPAQGAIAMRDGGALSEAGISASAFRRTLKRLAKDPAVKAVVLRIDSPGGSALASDLMWHDLMEFRKEKPLVASVGNMAASGGYYMACTAGEIFAETTSIVGSIGVVGGKFSIDQALAEHGINVHTFAASDQPGAGARATYSSLLTPWDEATRNRVQEHMNAVYELFLSRVAEGRGLPVDQIRAVAEGRVWSGIQGKERGLVDTLGGVRAAIAKALELAELPADTPVVVDGGTDSILELLGLGEKPAEEDVRAALASRLVSGVPSWTTLLRPAQRTAVSTFAPLLQGETVVAALPFLIENQ